MCMLVFFFCKMKTNVRICNTLVFCMNSNTRPIIPLLVRIFQSPTVGVLLQTGFFRLTSSVIKRFMYWLVWIKYSPLFLFLLLCYWYTYCEFGAGKSEILFLESSLITAQAWKILVTNATLLQAWFWLVSKQQKRGDLKHQRCDQTTCFFQLAHAQYNQNSVAFGLPIRKRNDDSG